MSQKLKRILLTTPDYPPKLGGLATFTLNIEKSLQDLDIEYDLFVWSDITEIRKKRFEVKYDLVINIHFMGGYYLHLNGVRQINFVHGSEVLFYSPQWPKRLIKKMLKKNMLEYFEKSFLNCFISDYTFDLLERQGLRANYARDVIFQNCIEIPSARISYTEKSLDTNVIKLISVCRDVPHKNLNGVLAFAGTLAEVSNKEIHLYWTRGKVSPPKGVYIHSIEGIGEEDKEMLLQEVHFNLLLSLDHTKKGFVEGFGLTVLEAGKYGRPSIVLANGGLKESVHHKKTGWVFEQIEKPEIKDWWLSLNNESYQEVSKNCYEHTHYSHDRVLYQRLLLSVLEAR